MNRSTFLQTLTFIQPITAPPSNLTCRTINVDRLCDGDKSDVTKPRMFELRKVR